jgi:hypothetical protein
MKATFISVMALGVAATMAGPADRALAGEPMVLTEQQLDKVTAGEHVLIAVQVNIGSGNGILIDITDPANPSLPDGKDIRRDITVEVFDQSHHAVDAASRWRIFGER